MVPSNTNEHINKSLKIRYLHFFLHFFLGFLLKEHSQNCAHRLSTFVHLCRDRENIHSPRGYHPQPQRIIIHSPRETSSTAPEKHPQPQRNIIHSPRASSSGAGTIDKKQQKSHSWKIRIQSLVSQLPVQFGVHPHSN